MDQVVITLSLTCEKKNFFLDMDQNLATQLVARYSSFPSCEVTVVEIYHSQDNSKHLGCPKDHSENFIFVFNLHNNPTMHYYCHFKMKKLRHGNFILPALVSGRTEIRTRAFCSKMCALHHYTSPSVTDTSCTPFAVTCLATAASGQPHTGPTWHLTFGSDLTPWTVMRTHSAPLE